ncbi:MAG: RNA methyltransferase [Bdellovibrionota bacterium]
MSHFPLDSTIDLGKGVTVPAAQVVEVLGPILTAERKRKIDAVVTSRQFSVAVVLESIYDRGNISAVMRTAEGMGFSHFHVIETQEKFKEANRVTQGADKWVELQKWKTTRECVASLKAKGFRICVTSLEAAKPIHELDVTTPLAYVLGNEKEGVSKEMLELADERIIIPMQGFVQSYNISVAGALGLYHIHEARRQKGLSATDLDDKQQETLRAHYYLRSLDSGYDILLDKLSR